MAAVFEAPDHQPALDDVRKEARRLYDADCVDALLSIQDAVREVASSISQ